MMEEINHQANHLRQAQFHLNEADEMLDFIIELLSDLREDKLGTKS